LQIAIIIPEDISLCKDNLIGFIRLPVEDAARIDEILMPVPCK